MLLAVAGRLATDAAQQHQHHLLHLLCIDGNERQLTSVKKKSSAFFLMHHSVGYNNWSNFHTTMIKTAQVKNALNIIYINDASKARKNWPQ
jgi:hypothetical protein